MSEPGPNFETSRSEKSRHSLEDVVADVATGAIAAVAAKYVAMIDAVICPSEIVSMTTPVDQMYSVSPFETPLSMMSALRLGR